MKIHVHLNSTSPPPASDEIVVYLSARNFFDKLGTELDLSARILPVFGSLYLVISAAIGDRVSRSSDWAGRVEWPQIFG